MKKPGVKFSINFESFFYIYYLFIPLSDCGKVYLEDVLHS